MLLPLFVIIPIGFQISILVHTGRDHLTKMGIASAALYLFSFLVFLQSSPITLLCRMAAIITFIMDRKNQQGYLSSTDAAFVAVSFLVFPVFPIIQAICVNLWNRYTYDLWLSSFRKDFKLGWKYQVLRGVDMLNRLYVFLVIDGLIRIFDSCLDSLARRWS